MNMTLPKGFADAIKAIRKEDLSKTPDLSSVDITPSGTTKKSVFDEMEKKEEKKARSLLWKFKKPNEWNSREFLAYWRDSWFKKFGTTIRCDAVPANYTALSKIRYMLEKQLKITECDNMRLKEYFDYMMDIHINDIVAGKKTGVTLYDMSKERYIVSYANRTVAPVAPVAIVKPKAEITQQPAGFALNDLNTAFKIHSQYFVQNYGLIVPVNYLITFKGKSKQEAVDYVTKAVTKMFSVEAKKEQWRAKLLSTTHSYGPYPKWLPFTDLSQIIEGQIQVCDDNPVFSFFRSK